MWQGLKEFFQMQRTDYLEIIAKECLRLLSNDLKGMPIQIINGEKFNIDSDKIQKFNITFDLKDFREFISGKKSISEISDRVFVPYMQILSDSLKKYQEEQKRPLLFLPIVVPKHINSSRVSFEGITLTIARIYSIKYDEEVLNLGILVI